MFLTRDECNQLASQLGKKYAAYLNDRYFLVEARDDSSGVYVTVTLRNQSASYVYPVESRLAHSSHDLSRRDGALLLADYIDEYFSEFFREAGDCYLPIDWAEFEWEGIPFQLKGQILNLEVEALADEWLARQGELH